MIRLMWLNTTFVISLHDSFVNIVEYQTSIRLIIRGWLACYSIYQKANDLPLPKCYLLDTNHCNYKFQNYLTTKISIVRSLDATSHIHACYYNLLFTYVISDDKFYEIEYNWRAAFTVTCRWSACCCCGDWKLCKKSMAVLANFF